MRSSISILHLAPDAWARGCGPWFTLPSVACPVGRSHSCCRSVSSLRSTCCHPGFEEWRCACARSCVAPASGLWFLGASLPSTGFVVAVQVWSCPVLLAWAVPCFSLGAWALGPAASSVAFRPSPSLGSVRRLVFWVRSPLPGNLSFRIRLRLILLFLELFASFCPGSAGREGGSAGLGLHPPASVPPDPATRLSGWPHWVTIPPKLQSAFYSAGKYSVGTNGVLRKLKHIFPNTYQRINMMARLPPR